MQDVWIAADSMVSPLGFTSEENYQQIKAGKSGIDILQNLASEKVYAGWIQKSLPQYSDAVTRFEAMSFLSVENALKKIQLDTSSSRVVFILSSTKGNIELLEKENANDERIHLHKTARIIAEHFGNKETPIVVSNACISGVMAVLVAKRLLQSGRYDHAVIVGTDVLTNFVVSGFQSLQAISPEPCRPFDSNRKGVNLGEAAATIIITTDPSSIGAEKKIKVLGGGLSNDANHISGPSRTGEELAQAIQIALTTSDMTPDDIDFISAHGTATLYNDEMEAKAFTIANLGHVPMNSLKGYFGHTLGAAGIVEMIISMHSLLNNELVPTFGFHELGVSKPVNVIKQIESKELTTCLKTASGFGGCNAAVILNKNS
jgi:3-oxoacyl-[acyl-carrier-protein] synthase-1